MMLFQSNSMSAISDQHKRKSSGMSNRNEIAKCK
jgi:hypothetical protein